jgi:phosphoserine phosphatase
MRFVATLIGAGNGVLTEEVLLGARQALNGLGAQASAPDWLAEGEAADLFFHELDPDQADAAIRQAIAGAPADCIAQPADGRRKRLLIADMESTIIAQEMLDEIADLKGLKPKIAAITARAMNGEIDFIAALKERVPGGSRSIPARPSSSRPCGGTAPGLCWCRAVSRSSRIGSGRCWASTS